MVEGTRGCRVPAALPASVRGPGLAVGAALGSKAAGGTFPSHSQPPLLCKKEDQGRESSGQG